MQAIVIEELGGPEVLRLRDVPAPKPGPGEIAVDVSAAGVNFMDTGTRTMERQLAPLPLTPGMEGAGRVVELGDGVSEFAVGDRVAWVFVLGSYAERIVLPATSAVPIPDSITDETAAALMMQGLTANHFTTQAYAVQPGDVTLVHAAAGGVGLMLGQLIKVRGGTVIGLVSRPEKVEIARKAGADHVLISTGDQFVDRVLELTGGEGVHVAYDGAGASTFRASLRVVRTNGTLAYFGPLIGEVPTIGLQELVNSVKLTYPVFMDHIRTRGELLDHSAELFSLVDEGRLEVRIGTRYALADAAQAHTDIESRRTTGKLLLIP
jgi:NADPH2:quinone reductase